LQDPGTNPITQAFVGYNVDFASQQSLQIHQQAAQIKQAATRLQFHEQIHIAVGASLTPCYRAEDADIMRAMLSRNAQDVFTWIFQQFFNAYRSTSAYG
jgi:hypothetical protein